MLPWLSHCINRLGDRFLNSSWSADWFNSNFWFYAKISYNHKILQLVCLHLKQTNWPTEYAFQTISVRLEFDLTGFTRINLIWTKQMWKPLQYEWCSPTLQKKQQQKKTQFCLFNLTDFNLCRFVCALLAGLVYFSAPKKDFLIPESVWGCSFILPGLCQSNLITSTPTHSPDEAG